VSEDDQANDRISQSAPSDRSAANDSGSPSPESRCGPPIPGKLSGRLHVLAAALLWSSSGLFVKAELFADWPDDVRGGLLAFWRAMFAGLVLVPLVRRPRWSIQLVPLSIAFALMCTSYLTAVVLTTAANAIWLQSTSPWWVLLLSVFLLREPVARRELIPLAFAGLGVGLILAFEFNVFGLGDDGGPALVGHTKGRIGVLCGLASGLFYACVVICMRSLRGQGAAWLVTVPHLFTAAVMLPWVIALGVRPSLAQVLVLALFGVVQMGLPYALFIRGLRTITAQEGVAIALIEPVLMPLWVFLLGQESPKWWTVAGSCLILAGLLLRFVVWEVVWGRQNRRHRTPL
jgi:DME family drug/metabolite transporter